MRSSACVFGGGLPITFSLWCGWWELNYKKKLCGHAVVNNPWKPPYSLSTSHTHTHINTTNKCVQRSQRKKGSLCWSLYSTHASTGGACISTQQYLRMYFFLHIISTCSFYYYLYLKDFHTHTLKYVIYYICLFDWSFEKWFSIVLRILLS